MLSTTITHRTPLMVASSTLSAIRFATSATATSAPATTTTTTTTDPNPHTIKHAQQVTTKSQLQPPQQISFISHDAEIHQPEENGKKKKWFNWGTKIYTNDGITHNDDPKFLTPHAYKHVGYSPAELYGVEVTHKTPANFREKFCYGLIKTCRFWFDLVTGYAEPKTGDPNEYKGTRWEMTESKWMTRIIFLESIAGVPGSVAAFLRQLQSLRLLKRDRGFIQTYLEEAEQERMHLLVALKIGKPSLFTRAIMYVGQGVFANAFFLTYMANPNAAASIVGYIEEEACHTYTELLKDLDNKGKFPIFENMTIPKIAVEYWPGLNHQSTFKDLILQIRADEAKHREVNHTFANLDLQRDRNPFALKINDVDQPQPNMGLKVSKPTGWERKDLIL